MRERMNAKLEYLVPESDKLPPEPGKLTTLCLWLDTVNTFSPTASYAARCRHARNFLASPTQAEAEPENCSP